jgi:translation initiation factor IF-1
LPYLSEFRLIRPQDGISVLPLPITRSKNRVLLVFLEVHYVSYVYKTFTYSPHSASGQSPRHYVRLSYGLLQKTIIRPIPYQDDQSRVLFKISIFNKLRDYSRNKIYILLNFQNAVFI